MDRELLISKMKLQRFFSMLKVPVVFSPPTPPGIFFARIFLYWSDYEIHILIHQNILGLFVIAHLIQQMWKLGT